MLCGNRTTNLLAVILMLLIIAATSAVITYYAIEGSDDLLHQRDVVTSDIMTYYEIEELQAGISCEEMDSLKETDTHTEVKQQLVESLSKNKTQVVHTPQLDNDEMIRIAMEFTAENPKIALAYAPHFKGMPNKSEKNKGFIAYKIFYTSEQSGNLRYQRVDRVADSIVSEANKCRTDSGKLLYVIRWFRENCTYTDTPENMWSKSLYGCLVEKEATCKGFAEAFHLLMNRLGIPCSIVVDTHKTNHAWNIVRVDGKTLKVNATQ